MDAVDSAIQGEVRCLEREGRATRIFRRLDPERQIAIVRAALVTAAEHGAARVAMREVARRAGVSVGALYTCFPDQAALVGSAARIAGRYLCTAIGGFGPMLAALSLAEGLAAYLEESDLLRFLADAAYGGQTGFTAELVSPVVIRGVRPHRLPVRCADAGRARWTRKDGPVERSRSRRLRSPETLRPAHRR